MTAPSVEASIRARFDATPATLHTRGQRKPFVLDRIDPDGIILLLGRQRNSRPLAWDCLEGVVPFLRLHPGWVRAGGTYVMAGEPDTLDEYLKDCISRQTSRWVTVVLEEAGVVRIDPDPPLRLQLTDQFK